MDCVLGPTTTTSGGATRECRADRRIAIAKPFGPALKDGDMVRIETARRASEVVIALPLAFASLRLSNLSVTESIARQSGLHRFGGPLLRWIRLSVLSRLTGFPRLSPE